MIYNKAFASKANLRFSKHYINILFVVIMTDYPYFLFVDQMCVWVVFSHEDHAYVCLPPSLLWVLAKGNWVGVNTQDAVYVYPLSLLYGIE